MCALSVLKSGLLSLALLFFASPALAAGEKAASKLSAADETFLKEAAESSQMEVELGKLAAQKASNDRVREFGRRMSEDQAKRFYEVKEIAEKRHIDPREFEGYKSQLERLSQLSGDEFDREYMRTMIKAHKEDLEKFQRQAEKGSDPDLKRFASKQVPVIQKHLELARTTGQQIGAASEERGSR